MQRFWSRIAVELGQRAGLVAAVGLVVTGALGFGITRLDFATDQDSYLNRSDQVAQDNVTYQSLFGGQAMLTVYRLDDGVDLVEFLAPANQERLARLSGEIQDGPGVRAVITPFTAVQFSDTLIQRTPDGETTTDPTQGIAGGALAHAAGLVEGDADLQEVPGTPEAEARTADSLATLTRLGEVPVERRTLHDPEWREFLIFDNQGAIRKSLRPFLPNERTAQIVTRLDGNMSIEDEGTAAEHVTARADATPLDGATSTTVGAPTLLQDINDYLRGGILSLGALGIGMMFVILLVLFHVRWRLLPLLVILVGLTWAFGLAGYLGIPLSLVTISGLPVMLGIGIDYAIQMHARIEEEVVIDRDPHPIQEATRNLGPGLLVVTFDAVLAFAALLLANVPMIRDFGRLLMIGIAAICLCSIILPIALLGMRENRSRTTGRDFREGALGRLTIRLGSLTPRLALPFAALSILVLAGGIAVEGEIAIKADPVEWVDQSSETIGKIDTIQAQTGSSSELGVFVTAPNTFDQETVTYVHTLAGCALGTFPSGPVDQPLTRENCERDVVGEQTVEVDGEERPALLTASSIVTTLSYVIEIPGATPLPPRASDVAAAWRQAPDAIKSFTAEVAGGDDGAQVQPTDEVVAPAMNLIFRTGYSSLSDGEEVVRHLRAGTDPPGDISAVPSGLAVVGVGLLDNIESNRSLLTYYAIGFVGLFLAVRLRSITRSLLSLVPVLIATGLASLVAWGLGLELSPMTAVGGPLVVAICTEFTSLLLLRFVEERKRGFPPEEAIRVTAGRTGRAFIVSAVTGVAGVAVIATSSLPLLRDFGLIVALNVTVALLSALVVLPPMLVWADQEGREWVSRRLVSEADLARSRHGRSAVEVPVRPDPTGG